MHCMPAASQWPDVVHKPNPFVAKRFVCVGNALAWEILPCRPDVPNSDGATSRCPACGSSACRSSTGGKLIRGAPVTVSTAARQNRRKARGHQRGNIKARRLVNDEF